MKHWVQRYNRFTKGGFFTMWQYNLFTEDFEVCKSPDSDLSKPVFLMLREKKNLQLVTYYWRPNLYHCCESFFFVHGTEKKCDGACKEGSVCRAALERSKKQPINCEGETSVSKFLQDSVREHEQERGKKKKRRKTDKYRSEQWTRKMNLTQEVLTSNQSYCVLGTQCNCELEYQLCCAIPRLNIIVLPLRMETAITEHKSNHFPHNTQWNECHGYAFKPGNTGQEMLMGCIDNTCI